MNNTTRSLKERVLSLFLAMAMVFGFFPSVSLAEDVVTEPTDVTITGAPSSGKVTFGDTLSLTASVNGTIADGTWGWTVDDDTDLTITGDTAASLSATATSSLTTEETVTFTATYTYEVDGTSKSVSSSELEVTFEAEDVAETTPSISISRSPASGNIDYNETLTLTADVKNPVTGGTVTWTSNDSTNVPVTADASDSTKATAKANATLSQNTEVTFTATYTYDTNEMVSETIKVTFNMDTNTGTPSTPTPSSLAVSANPTSLTVGQTATASATVTYDDNTDAALTTGVTYTSSDEDVVKVSGSTLSAISVGTATITGTYTENGTPVTGTVDITVTDSSTDSSTPTVDSMKITSGNNSNSTSITSSTLSTTGTKSDILTINLYDSAGGSISGSALNNVKWSWSPSSSVVSGTQQSTGNAAQYYFQAVGAGEVKIEAYYDANGNGAFDEGEKSAEYKIIVSGITVDASAVASGMLTHSTSDVITVTKHGTATGITWTPRSSGIVSVEYLNDDNTQAILKSNNTTGTVIIDIDSSDGTASFPVTVNDAVAEHIIPVENINTMNVLKFSSISAELYSRSKDIYPDSTLATLQNIEVAPAQGILYIGYRDETNPGAGVATSGAYSMSGSPSAMDIVFVPNPDYTGTVAIIKYTGVTSNGETFYGEIHANLAPIEDVFTSTATKEPVTLDSYAFEQIAANSGKTIDYIVFALPDENKAVLYYDYKAADDYHHILSQGEQLSKNDIDRLTVIPTAGFYGSLIIPYVITATDGQNLIGELTIEIAGYGPEGPIVYNTAAGEYVTFLTDDFHTNVNAITGTDMNYITFMLPDSSMGTLYELYYSDTNYRKTVTENTAYYASARSPRIDEVSFVPTAGFTGSCDISFIGYDMDGTSYLGTVEVNIGTQTLGDINYICSFNSYVPFYEGDFNQFSRDHTGYNVDYITFPSLPSSTQGSLRLGQTSYHDGVSVTAGTQYYYNDTPLMSKLTFNAASSYSGMVTIPFEGVSVGGTEFAGTLTIVVTNQNLVKVPYNATFYNPATFDSIDFEHYAQERTGSSLDYIRFELPQESSGVLYYNYTNEDDYGSLVNVSTNYYVNQSPFLSSVTFVPDRHFQGTTQINFTGWGENGKSFSGVITVYVADGGDPLTNYMYSGEHLYLNSAALNDFCFGETGSNLNYVTITSPSITTGYLYQDYDSAQTAHTSVKNNTKLYKSQTPYIDHVAFVPADGYVGTVDLSFTAVAIDGSTCTGSITILVRPTEANSSVYYYTSFSPIQLNEDDIYKVWGSEAIDYIQIHNVPTATQGKLYYENNLSSLATTDMKYYSKSSETGPYISQMVYAPRAGFSGTMIITYTATTVSGRSFSGEISVVVTTGQPSLYFNDMSYHLWATASADYLFITQVSTGVGNSGFAPAASITRGDFALMLTKAFRFTGSTENTFVDVASDAYYATAIHTLRALGITSGYEGNTFRPEDQISRQDAMIMLSTAMTIANKGVPTASTTVLNQFNDRHTVAQYAETALAAMVSGGLLNGSNGNLNPEQSMTRAEMAVVLHQAMTY